MTPFDLAKFREALEQTVDESNFIPNTNDYLFIERTFKDGIDKYVDRLSLLGFENHKNVLDAGSGFGQWSLALSFLNQNVTSVDSSQSRVDFLNKLINKLEVNNLIVDCESVEKLPYKEASFDAIFCYSVLYRTNWKNSIREFSRLLSKGGRLYICSNGLGWYFYNIINCHHPANDYNPQLMAMKAIEHTINGQYYENNNNNSLDVIIPSSAVVEELKKEFIVSHVGPESSYHDTNAQDSSSRFFIGEFDSFEAVYEIVAIK